LKLVVLQSRSRPKPGVISERTFEIKHRSVHSKTERVLARLIQLSKNELPVWQESNCGFGDSNTPSRDVKADETA